MNDKTVTFTLKEVNSFFFTNTTIGLLPYHILGKVPIEEIANHELNQFPIGTGPYKLAEPITNIKQEKNEIHLTVFEKYYGEKPNITDLRFTTFPDEETLFKAKKSLNALSKITSVEYIKELEDKGNFKLYPYSLPQYTAVFFNTESPIMQNMKVRLALSKAIDKNELVPQLGYKIRIDTPLLELHQENWLHKTSKEEAMGALYDAGWRFEAEGTPEKTAIRKNENGQELSLIMIAQNFEQNPIRKKENEITIDFLKQAWESIGVKLTIEMLDSENFQEKIQKREYDLLLTGQGMGYNLDTYAFWHSSQANESGLNLSNYKNPIADNLIEAIRTTFDEETRLKKLQNLAETIQSDIPAVFLYSPVYYYAVDQKVKNIELGNLAQPWDRLTHIEKWYMKEKKIN
jgi:peptide/nickel transport system substrate-binding protein